MIEFRQVCPQTDRTFVEEMFVSRAFERASEAGRQGGLVKFKASWLESLAARSLLDAFESSLADEETIARVICVNKANAGLIWVTRGREPGEPPYAELRLVAFYLHFQRQGLGRMSLAYIEEELAKRGTGILRSTGSTPSDAVRRFHESLGFAPVETVFEKQLSSQG